MQSTSAVFNEKTVHLLNGLLFVALFASTAWQLSQWGYVASLGLSPLIVGIALGISYGNTLRGHLPANWLPGVLYSSRGLLRAAIVLYGFRLTFQDLARVGLDGFAVGAIMLTTTFLGGTLLGTKVFGMPRRLAMLTAAGSAVCGAAAVLAVEPVVKAKSHESSIAVGTVVVFGTLAMFVYPALYNHGLLDLTQRGYGMFVGGTIHEVAHAVAAGRAVSSVAGDTAVITKMLRVMLIAPLLVLLGVWVARFPDKDGHADAAKASRAKRGHNLRSFPWFALLFIACIGINSLGIVPPKAVSRINDLDIFLLTMAMCALGMETSWSKVRLVGPKPFVLAGLLFVWLAAGGYAVTRAIVGIGG
ncbi:Uncharacterized protein family UPF0324 [Solidesulfovibrio fructosivorans JJ]]|uniref:Uncharacterized protein family UPF0324 n=1 Tax=Solidesulfovibrio fructosivorans JJ] TaxID=596151 RepID=E1K1U1_SOLFR|nr:YeiH family protein [Solidesulfovibrio fructosivorans]EFL49441.1 Uncharacterized protein family UPF0324 [Solidesulfovibrio fructosivorans JJ]]